MQNRGSRIELLHLSGSLKVLVCLLREEVCVKKNRSGVLMVYYHNVCNTEGNTQHLTCQVICEHS